MFSVCFGVSLPNYNRPAVTALTAEHTVVTDSIAVLGALWSFALDSRFLYLSIMLTSWCLAAVYNIYHIHKSACQNVNILLISTKHKVQMRLTGMQFLQVFGNKPVLNKIISGHFMNVNPPKCLLGVSLKTDSIYLSEWKNKRWRGKPKVEGGWLGRWVMIKA